jgi:hypothetical protein
MALSARWVVTPDEIRLSMATCQSCHTRYMPDGTTIDGAPAERGSQGALIQRLTESRERAGGTVSLDERRAQVYQNYRAALPWLETDAYDAIKSMTRAEIEELNVEGITAWRSCRDAARVGAVFLVATAIAASYLLRCGLHGIGLDGRLSGHYTLSPRSRSHSAL